MQWLKKLLAGAKGKMIRSLLPTAIGYGVAKLQGYEWFVAAGPLLTYFSRKLHEKYPGKFDWLPF